MRSLVNFTAMPALALAGLWGSACAGPPPLPHPRPRLDSLAPSSAVAGGPAFTLTVTGADFLPAAVATWNGAPRPTTWASATLLTVAIPPADLAAARLASVAVVNPAPGGGSSDSASFQVYAPVAVTIAVAPPGVPLGQGATLTWTATGAAACSASGAWSGARATSGSLQLEPTAPGALTHALTCSGPGGEASASATLTVTPAVGGQGATLPYREYEAEDLTTTGTILGPSRTFGDLAAEASGRRAVRLDATGQFVQLRTEQPANSLVLRYAIPDAPDGGGLEATLGLYLDGVRVRSLALTSRYTWVYGGDTNSADKNPAHGGAHHFYDEVHALLGELPVGTSVTLQRDDQDRAAFYVLDLVDLEEVPPPLPRPSGSLAATDFGATPDDGTDDSAALQAAITAAGSQGRVLWLPVGAFDLSSSSLRTSGVTIQGAGMWYSMLRGRFAHLAVSGDHNQFHDFALFGEVTFRDDAAPNDGFRGPAGTGSRMENVWIEHVKAGWWVDYVGAAPTTPQTRGLVVHGVRVRDTYADGITLANGASDSTIEQSTFRNTGDDAVASFSPAGYGPLNSNNVFQFNTVQLPWRGDCFALYGGQDQRVQDSSCFDTVDYPGTLLEAYLVNPFAGTATVQRLSLVRAGGLFGGGQNGALEIIAFQSPIAGVVARDLLIDDATLSGIQLGGPFSLTGVALENVFINGPGTTGLLIEPNSIGSASATSVVVVAPGQQGLADYAQGRFSFVRGPGDWGW